MSGGQCELRYSEGGEARQHSGEAAEYKGRRHPTRRRKTQQLQVYTGRLELHTYFKFIYLNALENLAQTHLTMMTMKRLEWF